MLLFGPCIGIKYVTRQSSTRRGVSVTGSGSLVVAFIPTAFTGSKKRHGPWTGLWSHYKSGGP